MHPPSRRSRRRSRLADLALLTILFAAAACDESPSAPSPPPDPGPTGTAPVQMTVHVESALDLQAGIAAATLRFGRVDIETDGAGNALVQTKRSVNDLAMRLLHPAFVERDTSLTIPGQGAAAFSLIPLTLDLASFEEFSPRTAGLRRWTRNPRLLVADHTVDFDAGSADAFLEFPVLNRPLAPAQLQCLVDNVAASLAEMSGGHLSWATVEIARLAPGSRIRTDRTPEGTILVMPATALGGGVSGRGTAYVGGSEAFALTRGAMWMSETQNFCFATLLARHELGHALGYQHVTRRASIMGSPALSLVNDFDRSVIEVLFQRRPGNRTPDRDPPNLGAAAVNPVAIAAVHTGTPPG